MTPQKELVEYASIVMNMELMTRGLTTQRRCTESGALIVAELHGEPVLITISSAKSLVVDNKGENRVRKHL